LLSAAAEGRCGVELAPSSQTPSRAERKARDRQKKAYSTLEELIDRSGGRMDGKGAQEIYESFAALLEERAVMREMWAKREKDFVFHELGQECRPLPVPLSHNVPAERNTTGEHGASPLPGSPSDLHAIATKLRALGKSYATGKSTDLPSFDSDALRQNDGGKSRNDDHAKNLDWSGWSLYQVGLEMQCPWASALLDGRKTIETRTYDLPTALIGKKIMIIQSPKGSSGVSAMGDRVDFAASNAEVIGWCTFTKVNHYKNGKDFATDEAAHLVSSDSGYGWKEGKTKVIYGWVVGSFKRATDRNIHSAVRRMRSLYQLQQAESTDDTSMRRGDGTSSKEKNKKRKRY
jgi:hypothetical protein